jgi:hypothetical protein
VYIWVYSNTPLVSCTERVTGKGVDRERWEAAVGATFSISAELLMAVLVGANGAALSRCCGGTVSRGWVMVGRLYSAVAVLE